MASIKHYANAAARVADQANVAAGITAEDNDSGQQFVRTTAGWAPERGFSADEISGTGVLNEANSGNSLTSTRFRIDLSANPVAVFSFQWKRKKATVSVDLNPGLTADADAAVAAAGGLRLMGYSCRESAGAPAAASFRIMHGATAAGGTVLVDQKLAASQSNVVWFGNDGIPCASGLSIDWVSGTVDVELYYKTVETVEKAYVVINESNTTEADNKLAAASTRRVIELEGEGEVVKGTFVADSLATADLISYIDIKTDAATTGAGNFFSYEGVAP